MPELDAGCRIGPYEVLARLGSGGMGEVYRARDTRLGRLVALKRIRPEVAQDSSRVERFVREARAVARLTHPHISTLYDHAVEDGQHFLVIEHLEGETLAARIARAPSGLPVSEAVSIAIAVGDALAFAHRHAIVHRDVKPSNIMITPVGVKLLDFGLAQLREDDEQPVEAMTMTRASLTSEQGVVGTLPYMAPEQLTGRADTRSDIFALGAVLYEMLTGQRAFQGATATSVMAAILERDPPPLPATLPSAFRHLERVVRKCLAKAPDARWQSAADLADELRWMATLSDDSAEAARTPASGARSRRSALTRTLALVAVSTAFGALAAFLWLRARPLPVAPVMHLSFALPADASPGLSLSPDGSKVAFVATVGGVSQIFLRSLSDIDSAPLKGTTGARGPFFSPDSQWIGFFADGQLRKMPLAGGSAQMLCAAPNGQAHWAMDGFIYFSNSADFPDAGISRVRAEGGVREVLTRPNRELGETTHQGPQLLPTGALLYSVRRQSDRVGFQVVIREPSGATHVIVDGAVRAQVFPDNILLYERNATLYLTRMDDGMTTAVLPGTVVVDGMRGEGEFFGANWAATSDILVYDPGQSARRRLMWVERNGTAYPLPDAPLRAYNVPRLSPDNTRVAAEIPVGPDYDVWIYDISRSALRRFTTDGLSRYPTWTPDSKFITVSRRRSSAHDIYWQEADESGEPRELLRGDRATWVGSWTPDQHHLVYAQPHANGGGGDIWTISLSGNRSPRAIMQTPAAEYGGWLSPDGRWLAYVSDRSGQFELFVKAFLAAGPGQQLSPDGAREPRWSSDGRELFYRKGDEMLAIAVETSDGQFSFQKPRVLFTGSFYRPGGPGIVNYDVSADGKRFLMLEETDVAQPMIRILQGYRQLRQ